MPGPIFLVMFFAFVPLEKDFKIPFSVLDSSAGGAFDLLVRTEGCNKKDFFLD